ncbi:hypothetical protein ACLEVG_21130, partial [Escherichia coli]
GPKTSIICSPMTSLKTSIKTITYLSDIGCLEIQGASLQTLKHCIEAKMLPADLMTRRAAIIMRGYISGLMENWLFAPQSFDLKKEARDYVAILLEMYLLCPTLRNPATNE